MNISWYSNLALSFAILTMNATFTANTPITDTETINRNAILISESPPSDICPIFETGETGTKAHCLVQLPGYLIDILSVSTF